MYFNNSSSYKPENKIVNSSGNVISISLHVIFVSLLHIKLMYIFIIYIILQEFVAILPI